MNENTDDRTTKIIAGMLLAAPIFLLGLLARALGVSAKVKFDQHTCTTKYSAQASGNLY